MEKDKAFRYCRQLAMLKHLLIKQLIDEHEYEQVLRKLMKDYGIVSHISA